MTKVFISYGRRDAAEFAARLAAWLAGQGFDPWLDVQHGIPVGAPFDVRIEIGISNSDVMLAVLSSWSVSPESFCRKELLFAQAKKKPIIPVRVADVCPPIQIISLNYIDAAADPDAAFAQLLPAIECAARSGKSELRDWQASSTGNAWWSARRLLDFREELALYGGSLVGRDWLFAEMHGRLARAGTHVLLIKGVPGVGKSAVAARMTTWPEVRGIHFCSRSNVDSQRPATWIRALVYQLAAQIPEYRRRIEALPPPDSEDAATLFRTLIADPLRDVQADRAPESPWVFVIDALDESVAGIGLEFVDFLAASVERLPDWFRLVVTTLPSLEILARFHLPGVEAIDLDFSDPRNEDDLERYVAARLEEAAGARLSGRQLDEIRLRLPSLARGNFLFARLALGALLAADPAERLTIDEVARLPAGLGGLYLAMFQKRFPDPGAYERDVLPLLDCLVAAPEAIPRDFLLEASGADRHAALRGMLSLSAFLDEREAGESLFHPSLIHWLGRLEESAEFAAVPEQGHARLAEACWRELAGSPSAMSAYPVRNAATHLRQAGRLSDLFTLLADDRYLKELLRLRDPRTLRRELLAGLAAAEAVGSTRDLREKSPASLAVAEGLARGRAVPVDEALRLFGPAVAGTSRILAGLAWLEMGWLHKDRDRSADRAAALGKARRALEEARNALTGFGFEGLLAEAHRSLGWMLKDLGLAAEAETAFLAARAVYEALGVDLQIAWTERDLSAFYRDQGRWDDSRRGLDRAETVFRSLRDRRQLAITLKDIGLLRLSLALHRPEERAEELSAAERAFAEAHTLAQATPSGDLDAWIVRYEGIRAAAAGRVQAGRETLQQARQLFTDFVPANDVLCRLCAARISEIRQPHLLELFGHEPQPRPSYEELFQEGNP
jgi:hypothetical protein